MFSSGWQRLAKDDNNNNDSCDDDADETKTTHNNNLHRLLADQHQDPINDVGRDPVEEETVEFVQRQGGDEAEQIVVDRLGRGDLEPVGLVVVHELCCWERKVRISWRLLGKHQVSVFVI